MTNQQLREYLTAVCDAENAHHACREALISLEEQVKRIPTVEKPTLLRPKYDYDQIYAIEPKREDYLLPWSYNQAMKEY